MNTRCNFIWLVGCTSSRFGYLPHEVVTGEDTTHPSPALSYITVHTILTTTETNRRVTRDWINIIKSFDFAKQPSWLFMVFCHPFSAPLCYVCHRRQPSKIDPSESYNKVGQNCHRKPQSLPQRKHGEEIRAGSSSWRGRGLTCGAGVEEEEESGDPRAWSGRARLRKRGGS